MSSQKCPPKNVKPTPRPSLHPLNISTSVTFCVPEHKLVPFVFVLCSRSRTQPVRAVFVCVPRNRTRTVFQLCSFRVSRCIWLGCKEGARGNDHRTQLSKKHEDTHPPVRSSARLSSDAVSSSATTSTYIDYKEQRLYIPSGSIIIEFVIF